MAAMAAAMAKVLRGRRSRTSSDFQHLMPAIYRRRTQEGVLASLVGSSPAVPAAGMARLMHTEKEPSALDKLKASYAQTRGTFQPYVTKSSILHMSERLDSIANKLTTYRDHWPFAACLAVVLALLAADAFLDSNDMKKKKSEQHVAVVNQFLWDAIALEQSARQIRLALEVKAAVKEGLAQPPTKSS